MSVEETKAAEAQVRDLVAELNGRSLAREEAIIRAEAAEAQVRQTDQKIEAHFGKLVSIGWILEQLEARGTALQKFVDVTPRSYYGWAPESEAALRPIFAEAEELLAGERT